MQSNSQSNILLLQIDCERAVQNNSMNRTDNRHNVLLHTSSWVWCLEMIDPAPPLSQGLSTPRAFVPDAVPDQNSCAAAAPMLLSPPPSARTLPFPWFPFLENRLASALHGWVSRHKPLVLARAKPMKPFPTLRSHSREDLFRETLCFVKD